MEIEFSETQRALRSFKKENEELRRTNRTLKVENEAIRVENQLLTQKVQELKEGK